MKKHVIKTLFSFMTALVLCSLLQCLPAKADDSGCIILSVSIYDAKTGERCEDNSLNTLSAAVLEDGHYLRKAQNITHSPSYASLLIGDSIGIFSMKTGSTYDVEIQLPESYELKSFRPSLIDGDSSIVDCEIEGKTLSFFYDSALESFLNYYEDFESHALYFSLEFYNGPKPEPKPEPDPKPQETEPETPAPKPEPTPVPSQKLTTVIRVPRTEYKLTAGAKSFSLNAAVENGNAPVYQSSDPSVIKVSKSGKITVKKPGKAVVSISSAATEQYTGASVSVNFTVTPKKVTSVKATSSKAKKATVSWKKVNSATGYRVSLATDEAFTKNVKTVSTKSTKATVSGLKKGATYYVRVCAYKLAGGSKIFGDYSSVKKVKIK